MKMSIFLRTDVTAVKLITIECKEFIFAGIGSHLNVFDANTNKLIERKQILKGQKIYGFVPDDNVEKILVFGGKQFTIITINSNNDMITVNSSFDSITCDDWLHSGLWQSNDEVALLTAHNTVQKYNIDDVLKTHEYGNINNSILYSGLLVPLEDGLLVFGGTVFSQIIVTNVGDDEPLHVLIGHKGVIFSIAYNIQNELIATTSDDRSVRVWKPKCHIAASKHTLDYWKNIEIVCKYKVYGHLARVMRCCITENNVISVGEDSAICFWDLNGKLAKKVMNQSGGIWAVDANDSVVVTGGSDGRVVAHPLAINNDIDSVQCDLEAKSIVFTAKGNLVIVCANDDVMYYDYETHENVLIHRLVHESTYKQTCISDCKQIITIIDMCGNLTIFIEDCKLNMLKLVIDVKLNCKVLSVHFTVNRLLVVCSDDGNIQVLALNGNEIIVKGKYILPNCKERWLTAAAFHNNMYAFGDRCGNLHFYKESQLNPIETVRKIHGRYGPTSIKMSDTKVITTGRDGTIKYYSLETLKHLHTIDVDFQWVEKFITPKLICGFRERIFVINDIESGNNIVEIPCGGGHRAWDVKRYFVKQDNKYNAMIKLVYLKNSKLHDVTLKLDDVVSRNVLNGTHSKEINCLKVFNTKQNNIRIIISGGEDTTVRISKLDLINGKINDEIIYKHLSSVRCLKILEIANNKLLLVSAGGRAQICVKIITVIEVDNDILIEIEHIIDYLIKGTDKERKGNKNWKEGFVDFDPETRIMDVAIFGKDNKYLIVAGCSDALIRVFKLNMNESDNNLKLVKIINYHKTCVLRAVKFEYEHKELLVTTSTIGEVVIWDYLSEIEEPIFSTRANKNGINSISIQINDNKILMATGGDDNAIHLLLLEKEINSFKVVSRLVKDNFHCSLISGIVINNNNVISVSIDERITIAFWRIDGSELCCRFDGQTLSDVADIHGLDVVENTNEWTCVIVFGKGIEVIRIPVQCNQKHITRRKP